MTAFSGGGHLVNGVGQLLSGVQIFLRTGQIILHYPYWDCQRRPRVKGENGRTEMGRILQELDLEKSS